MNSIDKKSVLVCFQRLRERIAITENKFKKAHPLVIQDCPLIGKFVDWSKNMAYLFDEMDDFIEPPDESEICESAIQPQNFALGDNYFDSPKGSIQSKSSDEEEEKTEKKKEKKKKEAKVKDFSIAQKEESKQRKEKAQ